jgi:glucose/arabinose dehydrogenase
VIDDSDIAGLDAAFSGSLSAAQGFAAARTRDQRFTLNALRENEYAHTVADLAQARELCGPERNRTAVLDFANVSASLFGHPPSGHWSYLHWGRSFSATAFVPPGRLFAGVGCAFDPKLPQNPGAHEGIWTVYGAYLRAHFRLAGETPFWRVLVVQAETGSSAPGAGNAR